MSSETISELRPCYIAVGGNIRPEDTIPRALAMLHEACPIEGISTFYRTAPIGRPEQPAYLNGVICIKYTGAPRILKYAVLRPIEEALGRKRTTDLYAARPIDLDVLVCGMLVINEPDLVIPDPDIRNRTFLAASLCDLYPELVLPDTNSLVKDILTEEQLRALVPDMPFTRALRERFLNES